jgi:uncharacterized delta-60 repeat protein
LVALLVLVSGTASARDGDPDLSFGFFGGGKVEFAYPGPLYPGSGIWDVALQSTGKLIVSGSRANNGNNDFGAMRLLANGTVDTTFGNNGASVVAFDRAGGDLADVVYSMIVQPDDSILLAGDVSGDSSTGHDMAVVKLMPNGQVDTSFGGAGKAIVPFNLGPSGTNDDSVRGIDLQSDHAILLAGSADSGLSVELGAFPTVMAIVRLTATGQRDASFDGDGRVTLGFGGDFATAFRARPLADGNHIPVVGGATTVPNSSTHLFALARLNVADGSLDNGFGVGGKATYDFAFGDAVATDFAELPDGRLMVCGAVLVNQPQNYDFACMRFLANGSPDPAFVGVVFPFDLGGDLFDVAWRVKRDSQGRFVLAGYASRDTNNLDIAVSRLTVNGQLDPSFGIGGRATFNSVLFLGSDRTNGATGLVLQPDDKIVVAGVAAIDAAGDSDFEVVRMIGDTVFSDGFGG